MDVAGSRRFSREASPERVKATAVARVRPAGVTRPFRRVQVVYYLTRNGHLEHPHYMEVTHMANQQLRLKDVMDRLTLLRGKGMPSLYSWSCKRSYKNGYVWNDLTENDPIYPAEGAEYVLKGSELIRGCTERFEQLQVSSMRHQIPEPTFLPKAKPHPLITSSGIMNPRSTLYTDDRFEEDEEEEKTSGYATSSNVNTPPFTLSSKGVSTEDIKDVGHHKNRAQLFINLDGESPPPSTSSASSDKATEPGGAATPTPTPGSSKRFGSGNASEGVAAPLLLSRNWVLLHLISCGRASCSKKKRGVLCGEVGAAGEGVGEEGDEDEEEIRCMSMNPRFGRAEAAEEYFSGSIAEAMIEERVASEATLKKSSSYNEERSAAAALSADTAAVAAEDNNHRHDNQKKPVKVKCIPRKKLSSSSTKRSSKK